MHTENIGINGLTQTVHSLIAGLTYLTKEPFFNVPNRKKKFSRKVKNRLCEIGRENGFQVCACDVDMNNRDYQEWLYDVTWLKYVEEDPQRPLVRIPLAAECEWGNSGDIKDDFDKLIQSTADVRLMIFDGTRHDSGEKVKFLSSLINRYNPDQQEKSLYLFASWEWAERQNNKWHFRYFIFNPGSTTLTPISIP